VLTSVSYALRPGSEVEWLTTSWNEDTTAIDLSGNEFANGIVGNDGANGIDGGQGADLMLGRAGNDWYLVDNAADVVIQAPGEGNDRILTSVSYALRPGSEVELLTTTRHDGTAAIDLSGNECA